MKQGVNAFTYHVALYNMLQLSFFSQRNEVHKVLRILWHCKEGHIRYYSATRYVIPCVPYCTEKKRELQQIVQCHIVCKSFDTLFYRTSKVAKIDHFNTLLHWSGTGFNTFLRFRRPKSHAAKMVSSSYTKLPLQTVPNQ